MRIALVGYGKMGKQIAELAEQRGHLITARIDDQNLDQLLDLPVDTEVAIEFSQPEAAFNNLKVCLDQGIPVISGTTGWLEQKPELEHYCRQINGTFFYASNFSLGVQIFLKLNQYLAKIMAGHPDYEIELKEIHHIEKKDMPSGTAISLAEDILTNIAGKEKWVQAPAISTSELAIESLREPQVPGTHRVRYYSEVDDLEITHTAHNRKGFAMGAVLVAEWIKDHKGVLHMDDFLNFQF